MGVLLCTLFLEIILEGAIGNRTRVKVAKNKLAPPFKTAEFDIIFGKGVSRLGEVIDLAVEHNIVNKAGAWFSYDETKLGQGREAVKLVLADNPELCDQITKKILEVVS